MALVERLAGIGDPETVRKLGVNAFHALLVELANGEVTRQGIIDYFQLDAGEVTELDWLIGRYNAQPTAPAKEKFVELMRTLFVLAEAGVPGYTTNADLSARIGRI
jgi:hypothetical protein